MGILKQKNKKKKEEKTAVQGGYLYGIRRRWLMGTVFVVLGTMALAIALATLLGSTLHAVLINRPTLTSFLVALGFGIVMLAVMVVSNLFFIRSIIQPITAVTAAAHRISEGSYGAQIPKKHEDEVGELTDAINNMSRRLNQTEGLKTEFISSVSHELRTPLAAITGWGETLLYDESLSPDARRGLEIISGEARRLSKLVEELLEFTRMEDGRFTLNVQKIDIAKELEETIFTYREHLRRDGIELHYTPYDAEIPDVPGDPERIRQVFYNILDNAAKHGRDGGKIHAQITLDEGCVAVQIEDFGSGIPEDELAHVKQKFFKGRNAKQRGSGIGLAVCEEIVRYHGGQLEIKNVKNQGLTVTVRLPMQ